MNDHGWVWTLGLVWLYNVYFRFEEVKINSEILLKYSNYPGPHCREPGIVDVVELALVAPLLVVEHEHVRVILEIRMCRSRVLNLTTFCRSHWHG